MREHEVGAVVVSYHPDVEVIENLRLLREQVERVVVVDNGSSSRSLASLQAVQDEIGFELIRNGENLGIATALNQGVRRVRDLGCPFVMLFDQDSRVTQRFVSTMLESFLGATGSQSLAIMVPRYVDRRTGAALSAPMGSGGHLQTATTSGSLMPMGIFEVAGWFADELFIDIVDYEYSLRVRRAGFTIDECVEAVLLHEPGSPTMHGWLGLKLFQAANYSPLRRYYQERNKIWLTRRYWRSFPRLCFAVFAMSVKDLLKIVLVEEDKGLKCRYFLIGIRDGLRGRTGKLVRG
jgi:rhamnosyltransferase